MVVGHSLSLKVQSFSKSSVRLPNLFLSQPASELCARNFSLVLSFAAFALFSISCSDAQHDALGNPGNLNKEVSLRIP